MIVFIIFHILVLKHEIGGSFTLMFYCGEDGVVLLHNNNGGKQKISFAVMLSKQANNRV